MQEVRAHVAKMKQDRVYVGEDVIVASASCLSHDIYAYISSRKSSPVEYKSSTGASLSQVSVAFYEPDHYRAVMPCLQLTSNEMIATIHSYSTKN